MRKHQEIAMLLSLAFTGVGMFYIGTPLMIVGGALLMVLQGMFIYFTVMTLGFGGGLVLPFALLAHFAGILIPRYYFKRSFAKDPYKEQRRERQVSTPWKIVLRTVIGVVIFSGAVYAGYTKGTEPFSRSSEEQEIVRAAAVKYLENKYREPFQVTEVDYQWHSSVYDLKAHPSQNPDIEFRLKSSDDSPPQISNDSYLNELWSLQLKENLIPLVDEFYPDRAFIHTYIWLNDKDEQVVEKNYNNIKGDKEAFINSQRVSLTVFENITDNNLTAEKERVMSLIRRMPEVISEGETSLEIEYYPLDMKPSNIDDEQNIRNLNDEKMTHNLWVDDIYKAASEDDIEERMLPGK